MTKVISGFLVFSILFIHQVFAQDRIFARTYQSNVLPKGVKDLEYWATYRSGRDLLFHRLDQRFELEFGLTPRLQTAFYFNTEQKTYAASDTSNEVLGSFLTSFSSEWKYKISDPVVNPVGVALYAEATVSTGENELETKLIFDKTINKHSFALNLVYELENEFESDLGKVETEKASVFEVDLGYMFNFRKNFGTGLEIVSQSEFGSSKNILFTGPTVFYSGERFFFIFNYLPQLFDIKTGKPELVDSERSNFRFLTGINL